MWSDTSASRLAGSRAADHWDRLALAGHAVWLEPPGDALGGSVDAERFRDAAHRFGYPVDPGPGWTDALRHVWAAFAARFLPAGGRAQAPTAAGLAHLEALATRWPAARFEANLDPAPRIS